MSTYCYEAHCNISPCVVSCAAAMATTTDDETRSGKMASFVLRADGGSDKRLVLLSVLVSRLAERLFDAAR